MDQQTLSYPTHLNQYTNPLKQMQQCSAWGSTIMIQLNSKQDLQIKIFFLIILLKTYFEFHLH